MCLPNKKKNKKPFRGVYTTLLTDVYPQDNSQKEWAFQNAVTIQTYSSYHPIPVPFNIFSTLVMCCCFLRKKWKVDEAVVRREQHAGVSRTPANKD